MILYLLTNSINGKMYVGQTTATLKVRWQRHVSQAFRGGSLRIYRAIRKYGPNVFKKEILGIFENRADLLLAEQRKIEELKTTDPSIGYNITKGGDGTFGFTKPGLFKNMKGLRFGRLSVISKSSKTCRDRRSYWFCICDCGKEVSVCGKQLRLGKVKSCGCLRSETMSFIASQKGGIRARGTF